MNQCLLGECFIYTPIQYLHHCSQAAARVGVDEMESRAELEKAGMIRVSDTSSKIIRNIGTIL